MTSPAVQNNPAHQAALPNYISLLHVMEWYRIVVL